jgi:hypothetical protein
VNHWAAYPLRGAFMQINSTPAGCRLLALAAALLGPLTPARADELLVMPYTCSMVGGRPMLARSEEQSHRIIGTREQRNFTACSPVNPDRCRQWTVHRFDLDCDGARVPWVSVVAAASEQVNDRAWVEDGRLRLRMGPGWSMSPDDPCGRRYDDRFRSNRMTRHCAERRAMAPAPVVDMPSGYAPMLGIDGIFVTASASAPHGAPFAGPPATALREPPAKAARPEHPSSPRSDPVAAARREPNAVAKHEPAPGAKPEPPPPPRAEARREAKEPAKSAPSSQASAQPAPQPAGSAPTRVASGAPGSPVVPKIINRPEPAALPPPPVPAAVSVAANPAPSEPPKVAINTPPGPQQEKIEGAKSAAAKAPTPGDDHTLTVSLLNAVPGPATGAIIVFAGLTLGLVAAFAVARRRERDRLASIGARDIASVPMERRSGRNPLVRQPSSRKSPQTAPPPAPAATSSGAAMAFGNAMPQTRDEAMQVLGLGVTPDATESAMKKIVDGLRASWHPDLAKSETDRQLRVLRMQQINAAWEIICAKGAAA